jgi:hypothetical protein
MGQAIEKRLELRQPAALKAPPSWVTTTAMGDRGRARDERLKANERAFRDFNLLVRVAAERVRERRPDELIRFACECSDPNCSESVCLYDDEYRAVRSDERRFFIVCGHDIPRIEDVVETHERYCVVQKH